MVTRSRSPQSNAASHGTVALNTQNNTITFTPEAGYIGAAGFSYTISDGRGGTASANVSLNVTTTPPPPTGVSFFSAANTPAQTSLNDGTPLDVGMKFTSSTAGQITALKFYRSAGDTGPDLLSLWTATGTKLGSATFTNTSASGWQTVTLPTAVNINANTTYIASYHTTGAYVATNNYFTSAVTSGPLTAPSTTTAGGNGVYTYGGNNTNGIFPTSTFGAANYWVDVVFNGSTGGGNNTPPTAVADTADATERAASPTASAALPPPATFLPTTPIRTRATPRRSARSVSARQQARSAPHSPARTAASCSVPPAPSPTPSTRQRLPCRPCGNRPTRVTDVFTYTMRDTAGATSTTTLTITIHGANDAPVLAAQTANQNAVVGSAFSLVLPTNTFTDVDTGDTLAYSATARGWLGPARMVGVQRNDTHIQRHAGRCERRHPQRQGHGHRSRQPRRQRDVQYCRDDNDDTPTANGSEFLQRVEHAGTDQSQRSHPAGTSG